MKDKQVYENKLEAEIEIYAAEIKSFKKSLESAGIGEVIEIQKRLNEIVVKHAELEKLLAKSRQTKDSAWRLPLTESAHQTSLEKTLRL